MDRSHPPEPSGHFTFADPFFYSASPRLCGINFRGLARLREDLGVSFPGIFCRCDWAADYKPIRTSLDCFRWSHHPLLISRDCPGGAYTRRDDPECRICYGTSASPTTASAVNSGKKRGCHPGSTCPACDSTAHADYSPPRGKNWKRWPRRLASVPRFPSLRPSKEATASPPPCGENSGATVRKDNPAIAGVESLNIFERRPGLSLLQRANLLTGDPQYE